jgi:hypothetical protein
MCTALIWFFPHEQWPLCIAFNRDERYARREIAPRLIRGPHAACLCPLDEQTGGTWLGANSHGLTMGIVNDVARATKSKGSRGLWLKYALLSCRTIDDVGSMIQESWSSAFQATFLFVGSVNFARVYRLNTNFSFQDLSVGFHTLCDSTGLEENKRSAWHRQRPECSTPPESYQSIRPVLAEHASTRRISETTCCHSKHSGTISSQLIRWDSESRLRSFYYINASPCSDIPCSEYSTTFQF